MLSLRRAISVSLCSDKIKLPELSDVAYKGNDIIYVQVCYLLGSKETTDREFGNLERIKDNYPKYVISADLPDFSRNGIKHFNIIKFLLEQ